MRTSNSIPLRLLARYSHIAPSERGGYHLVRMTRRFIPRRQWRGTFRTPLGFTMTLDLGTYPDCSMAVGLYELDTVQLLRRVLRPGDWFVDGGANIGYFTLLAARLVGTRGRVDAFEPDPINLQRLREHLAMNSQAAEVHVHPYALTDRPGMVDLFHPTGTGANHGMASLYPPPIGAEKTFSVEAVRLDDVLQGVPTLIKQDVEGAELRALNGMSRLLASPEPPMIIFEHNPAMATIAGHSPGDLPRLIESVNRAYRFSFISRRPKPVPSADHLNFVRRQQNILARVESSA
jgi:FkbM family methyltransferase